MARTISGIRQTVRQLLKDEFVEGVTQDWKDDEIDIHIGIVKEEVSYAAPNVVIEVLSTIADSRILDITSIKDLISIAKLEYPTGNSPRDFRNAIMVDNNTVEIDTTLTPSAGTSSTLTGTVTFLSGSAAITGSGTAFATELSPGDHIRKSTGTRWYRIESIESATALTLAEPCRAVDTGADSVGVTAYRTETVYLYCNKLHILTEDESTLKADAEKVLIDGTVASLAQAWVNNIRTNVREATTLMATADTAMDDMTARVTQAIADLVSGRAKIGLGVTQAIITIDSLTARISQATTDLSTGRALIGDKRTEAITALDLVSAEVAQARADLDTGRSQIDDTRTTADSAIDKMTARINQAIDNLQLGQTFINKVNYGGAPEDDYATYAARELSNANTLLGQARGYLGEGTTAGLFANYASRDLQAANGYINAARGYLALDAQTAEHANYAAGELNNANASLAQARGYLALDVESAPFATYAAREVQNANVLLAQAGGYLRQAAGRLSIAGAVNSYRTWANDRYTLYKRALAQIEIIPEWKEYPKD